MDDIKGLKWLEGAAQLPDGAEETPFQKAKVRVVALAEVLPGEVCPTCNHKCPDSAKSAKRQREYRARKKAERG